MHDRNGARLERGQVADRRGRLGGDRGGAAFLFGDQRSRQDVIGSKRGAVTELKEQVAAEEGSSSLLENEAGIPTVRNVRRVDAGGALAPQIDRLSILECPRRTNRRVVQPDVTSDPSVRRCRVGRRGKPFIERTTFVRLHVAERYPAQPSQVHDSCGGGADAGKQEALPAVEQQRLVGIDEELVKGDSGRRSGFGHEGREPINSIRNFIDAGFHLNLLPPGGFYILSV